MNIFNNIQFLHPLLLGLLVLVPALAVWYRLNRTRRHVQLRMPQMESLAGTTSWRGWLRNALPWLRGLALCLFILALARPQQVLKQEKITADGIDIMLVMDLSNSMLSKDFDPNRLEVSKMVAQEFVRKRQYDRIGLTLFAGEAFTQCPVTTDHDVLNGFISELDVNLFEVQGTAIGMGLASAVNWLKESESESKIIILLTDGVNNMGYVPPLTAAEIAKEYQIRVYTIGVGSNGLALTPSTQYADGTIAFRRRPVEIDEALLQEISKMTGGRYYRADSAESLKQIYGEIDTLEKTEVEITTLTRYTEEFYKFALAGILLLMLELLLRYSLVREIP